MGHYLLSTLGNFVSNLCHGYESVSNMNYILYLPKFFLPTAATLISNVLKPRFVKGRNMKQ